MPRIKNDNKKKRQQQEMISSRKRRKQLLAGGNDDINADDGDDIITNNTTTTTTTTNNNNNDGDDRKISHDLLISNGNNNDDTNISDDNNGKKIGARKNKREEASRSSKDTTTDNKKPQQQPLRTSGRQRRKPLKLSESDERVATATKATVESAATNTTTSKRQKNQQEKEQQHNRKQKEEKQESSTNKRGNDTKYGTNNNNYSHHNPYHSYRSHYYVHPPPTTKKVAIPPTTYRPTKAITSKAISDGIGNNDPLKKFHHMFQALQRYKEKYGNTYVPISFTDINIDKTKKLGSWVYYQQKKHEKNMLDQVEVDHLNSIDFCWSHEAIKKYHDVKKAKLKEQELREAAEAAAAEAARNSHPTSHNAAPPHPSADVCRYKNSEGTWSHYTSKPEATQQQQGYPHPSSSSVQSRQHPPQQSRQHPPQQQQQLQLQQNPISASSTGTSSEMHAQQHSQQHPQDQSHPRQHPPQNKTGITTSRLHGSKGDNETEHYEWENMFLQLLNYKKKHGHCNVKELSEEEIEEERKSNQYAHKYGKKPHLYNNSNEDSFTRPSYINTNKLYNWTCLQRKRYYEGKLNSIEVKQLNNVEFVWDLPDSNKSSKKGPSKKTSNDSNSSKEETNATTGTRQQSNDNSTNSANATDKEMEKIENSKPGMWGKGTMIQQLIDYKEKHGHCNVHPLGRYQELYKWCKNIRDSVIVNDNGDGTTTITIPSKNTHAISAKQIQDISKLGFSWKEPKNYPATKLDNADTTNSTGDKIIASSSKNASSQQPQSTLSPTLSKQTQRSSSSQPANTTTAASAGGGNKSDSMPGKDAQAVAAAKAAAAASKAAIAAAASPPVQPPPPPTTAAKIKNNPYYNTSIAPTWDDMYTRLEGYYNSHGNCNISSRYNNNSGYTKRYQELYQWINIQRLEYCNNILSKDRIEKLNSLRIAWDDIPKEIEKYKNDIRGYLLTTLTSLCESSQSFFIYDTTIPDPTLPPPAATSYYHHNTGSITYSPTKPMAKSSFRQTNSFHLSPNHISHHQPHIPPPQQPPQTQASNSAAPEPLKHGRPIRCNCVKSQCLKLYCECYSNQLYCQGCACEDCENLPPQKNIDKIKKQQHQKQQKQKKQQAPPSTGTKGNVSSDKTTNSSDQTTQTRRCRCQKSKCLKLYCECFAEQQYCEGCFCNDCKNLPEHETDRQKAIADIKLKNKRAFEPKITGSDEAGCKCKKSECLKKYCECYHAGAFCSETCKCVECLNFPGSNALIAKRTGRKTSSKKANPYSHALFSNNEIVANETISNSYDTTPVKYNGSRQNYHGGQYYDQSSSHRYGPKMDSSSSSPRRSPLPLSDNDSSTNYTDDAQSSSVVTDEKKDEPSEMDLEEAEERPDDSVPTFPIAGYHGYHQRSSTHNGQRPVDFSYIFKENDNYQVWFGQYYVGYFNLLSNAELAQKVVDECLYERNYTFEQAREAALEAVINLVNDELQMSTDEDDTNTESQTTKSKTDQKEEKEGENTRDVAVAEELPNKKQSDKDAVGNADEKKEGLNQNLVDNEKMKQSSADEVGTAKPITITPVMQPSSKTTGNKFETTKSAVKENEIHDVQVQQQQHEEDHSIKCLSSVQTTKATVTPSS